MVNKSKSIKRTKVKCNIIFGDSRSVLPPLGQIADLIITSPPYADARKKHYDSISPDEFVEWFSSFHNAFFHILKPNGSLVINIKDKVENGVRNRYVWKTIEKLSELGWFAIEDYIWYKTNPMPGYWPTRLRDGWEYCFHLAKTTKPYINQNAVKISLGDWAESRLSKLNGKDLARHNSENNSGFGRDLSRWIGKKDVLPSNVIVLPLVGKNYNHPAVFPVGLPSFFIKLLSPNGGTIVDPFGGSGTTAIAAVRLGRNAILVDNNLDYCFTSVKRLKDESENFNFTLEQINFPKC
ncbi:site-specific DNA-methyltransferase [Candidatus Microgenomates bacterium]|nr:site-specific DNA-methyltransferase [Candidatus Microgenomates bacterium]